MKKLSMFIAAFALAVPAPVAFAPAQAAAGGNTAAVSYCKNILNVFPDSYQSVGECVAILANYRSGDPSEGYAVHWCAFYQLNEPDVFYAYWDSKKDCVAEARTFF